MGENKKMYSCRFKYKKNGKERAIVFDDYLTKEDCEALAQRKFETEKYEYVSLYEDGKRILRLEWYDEKRLCIING